MNAGACSSQKLGAAILVNENQSLVLILFYHIYLLENHSDMLPTDIQKKQNNI